MFRGFHQNRPSTGVAQNPRDLRGGGSFVHRNGDSAGEPNSKINQRPFVTGPGHQPDAIPGLQTAGDEPLGDRRGIGREL